MYKIYTLSDPNSGHVKYVGITKRPLYERMGTHLHLTATRFRENKERSDWIKSLKDNGQRPIMEIVEIVNANDKPFEKEQFWTQMFKSWGFILFNKREGNALSLRQIQLMKSMPVGKGIPKKSLWKKVLQLTTHGDFIKEWDSITEAAKHLKIDRSDISKVCRGKQFHVGAFRWIYKEDYLKQQSIQ